MTRQMHVVEVIRGLGNGGTEQALLRRLHHQPESVRTTLVCTAPHLDEIRQDIDGVDIVMIEPGDSLISTLTNLHADVVVTHMPRDSFRVLRSALPSKIPVVVVAHASVSTERPRLQPLVTLALRAVNRRAALHIAVSNLAASGRLCKGARTVVVQQLGGELDRDAPVLDIWPSGTHMRLLTLSRITKLKNLVNLVHAIADEAALMRSTRAFVTIVGDGPESASVQQAIDQRAVHDIVATHPWIQPAAGVLKSADVLLVSSLEEGGPITLFEALLAGTRITSTPVGVAPDILSDDSDLVLLPDSGNRALRAGIRASVQRNPVTAAERIQRAEGAAQWDVAQTSRGFYALLESTAVKHAPT